MASPSVPVQQAPLTLFRCDALIGIWHAHTRAPDQSTEGVVVLRCPHHASLARRLCTTTITVPSLRVHMCPSMMVASFRCGSRAAAASRLHGTTRSMWCMPAPDYKVMTGAASGCCHKSTAPRVAHRLVSLCVDYSLLMLPRTVTEWCCSWSYLTTCSRA